MNELKLDEKLNKLRISYYNMKCPKTLCELDTTIKALVYTTNGVKLWRYLSQNTRNICHKAISFYIILLQEQLKNKNKTTNNVLSSQLELKKMLGSPIYKLMYFHNETVIQIKMSLEIVQKILHNNDDLSEILKID